MAEEKELLIKSAPFQDTFSANAHRRAFRRRAGVHNQV